MLKSYIAYSKKYGSQEGAILVLAYSVREAKKLAWGHCPNVDEWIDQAATLIKDKNILVLANQDQLLENQSHIVECPEHCESCGLWGCGLTSDNLCANCNQYPGAKLINLFARFGVNDSG